MRRSLWRPLPHLASPYKGEEPFLCWPPLTESAKIKSPFSQIMREEPFLCWPPPYKGEETEWRPHKSLKSQKNRGGLFINSRLTTQSFVR